jgi:hypothetical protein
MCIISKVLFKRNNFTYKLILDIKEIWAIVWSRAKVTWDAPNQGQVTYGFCRSGANKWIILFIKVEMVQDLITLQTSVGQGHTLQSSKHLGHTMSRPYLLKDYMSWNSTKSLVITTMNSEELLLSAHTAAVNIYNAKGEGSTSHALRAISFKDLLDWSKGSKARGK